MSMRLFFVLVALGGSVYLFVKDRTDRYVMGALVASSLGLLLQMNVISLRMQYARSIVWAAIAVCAGLIWSKEGSKNGATVAAAMAFVSTLTVALSLRILR